MCKYIFYFTLIISINFELSAPSSLNAQTALPNLKEYRKKITFKDPFLSSEIKPLAIFTTTDTPKSNYPIKIEITNSQNKHILSLLKEKENTSGLHDGYRIQLLSGDRNAALQAKFDFLEAYPEIEAYVIYEKPYFRVRIGNFISKSEAEEFCKEIKIQFPSAIIVKDKIFH
ncbi:MAG: SPOR domain-containing protein [Bacteroidia bacterium]|nr:SPOR domain-containing protein [Bacteroidia bacterium]MDW8157405.1 SPOR domain-containing protein [Bacteroidia bacterium]